MIMILFKTIESILLGDSIELDKIQLLANSLRMIQGREK